MRERNGVWTASSLISELPACLSSPLYTTVTGSQSWHTLFLYWTCEDRALWLHTPATMWSCFVLSFDMKTGHFQGRNHWRGRGVWTYKIWMDHPNFFDEECDYRYVTDYSARNWVYHPYFVLYNNLDQEIGTPNFEHVVAPLAISDRFFPADHSAW